MASARWSMQPSASPVRLESEQGEAVEGVVGGLVLEEDLLEVLAGVFVVALVEQGDGVVVTLFVSLEVGGAFVDLADAGGDVHADAVGEILGCGVEHRGEGFVGLLILAGLHELERALIEGERGLAGGVDGVLWISGEDARGLERGGRFGSFGFGGRCSGLRCHGVLG
jgi:hypothetical protein